MINMNINMNKNKKIKVISNDSLKRRCSSLSVNLSCASNLTDSGNESLKQTNTESINNASGSSQSKQIFVNHKSVSYDIPLKSASVILEKISHRDVILNKHCENLKYAILSKTKQIFDKQDELSVKTSTILGTKDNQLDTIPGEKNIVEDKDIYVTSNGTDKIIFVDRETNLNQSIKSTPKDKYKNKSIEKQRKQKKLRKRCLFIAKEQLCDTSVNRSNVKSMSCLSRSNNVCYTGSCTVNEIYENPCKLNVSLDTSSESVSKDQSFSVPNISEHEDTFTATPIACSTMIDENAKISGTRDEVFFQAKNSLSSRSNAHGRTRTTSMDMTNVCGGLILCDKPKLSIKCVTKNASKNLSLQTRTSNNCSSASVESSLQIDSNDEKLLNKTSKQFRKFVTINKDTEENTNMQENNTNTETDSANTVQTSLNVNTSMDLLNQSNINADKCTEKDINLAASEEAQESMNTVCTSLQINTSLNASSMLQEISCTNKASELKNAENEKNGIRENNNSKDASLTKDFENILTLCNTTNCFDNRNTKIEEQDKINSIAINNQSKQVIDKIHSNEQSYIEATPYPMLRSVMLRSQLKQNSVAHSFRNSSQFNNNENKQMNSTRIYLKAKSGFLEQEMSAVSINLSEGQEELKDNTVSLNSSSYQRCSMKTQTSVVMKEMINENKLEEDINAEKVDKKKGKRKLMPLRECSQLSFSPVEKQYLPPRCLIFRKNIKNKCNKINVNGVQRDKREKKKDSNEKKTRGKKPRKVISKKIVVKKIVNQDILKELVEGRENSNETQINTHSLNTNSSNDFQSLKEPSTIQIKRRAHRIIIVTTGLSNEDKSMVKGVVKALGSAKIESNVTKRTTHVVTTGVRTINLLHGIIQGCWLVGLEWVLKSLENNAWLNPEEYEVTHFSKAVLENRKDRQLFGSSYVPELFATCGYVYIEKNTTPPYNVLKDLIKAAGGCITENPEVAKVTIGTEGLKETWVLDCITSGELQPYNQYRRY